MPRYCPTCNRSSDTVKFYGSFCEFCTKEKFSNSLKRLVEVTRCKNCERIRKGSFFVEATGRNMDELLASKFHGYRVHLINLTGRLATVDITEATPEGDLSIEKGIEIKYNKVLCEKCYKRMSDYYEAVIQLRGSKERIDKFVERIYKFFEKQDEYVSQLKDVDNGIDVFVSNKKTAGAFMSEYDLKPNVSFTLYGEKNGRRIYKNTYALHL